MPYKILDEPKDSTDSKNKYIQFYCEHCGCKTIKIFTEPSQFEGPGAPNYNHEDPFICVKNLREQIKTIAKASSDTYFLSDENIN